MRLTITKSKNSESFFVIKSVTINGKRTSKVIEKLGNLEEVTLKAQGQNPYVWAKQYVELLNKEEKEKKSKSPDSADYLYICCSIFGIDRLYCTFCCGR